MAINLQNVSSSMIAAAGYDPNTQILEVQFLKGGRWQYFNVPPNVAGGLFTADSIGRYFIQNIRDTYDGRTV